MEVILNEEVIQLGTDPLFTSSLSGVFNRCLTCIFGILHWALTMLIWAVFVTSLALVAKERVLRDCST